VFEDKHRPLKLYAHLISKTTIAHDKPIQKHIDAFASFCSVNRNAIFEKDHTKLSKSNILYSKRVFINMKEIFELADKDTREIIWKHLLTISALVDPLGEAKKILKEESSSRSQQDGEVDFLSNILSRVESHVDPNANPMEAITNIMQSGIFTELVETMGTGLQDGSLDLGKLMGTVQTMVTKMSGETGNDESSSQAMSVINSMMSNMQTSIANKNELPISGISDSSSPNQMPDLTGMIGSVMSGLMSGNTNNGMPDLAGMMKTLTNTESSASSLEQRINQQVEKAKLSGELPTNTSHSNSTCNDSYHSHSHSHSKSEQ
jgi:hypothetical protein